MGAFDILGRAAARMEPQAQGVFNALKLAQRARPPSEELNPYAAHWGGMAAGAPIGGGIGATMDDGEGGNLAAEGALMGMMGGGPAAGFGAMGARGLQAAGRGANDVMFALQKAGLSKAEQVMAYFQRLGRPPNAADFNAAQSIIGKLTPEDMAQLNSMLQPAAGAGRSLRANGAEALPPTRDPGRRYIGGPRNA